MTSNTHKASQLELDATPRNLPTPTMNLSTDTFFSEHQTLSEVLANYHQTKKELEESRLEILALIKEKEAQRSISPMSDLDDAPTSDEADYNLFTSVKQDNSNKSRPSEPKVSPTLGFLPIPFHRSPFVSHLHTIIYFASFLDPSYQRLEDLRFVACLWSKVNGAGSKLLVGDFPLLSNNMSFLPSFHEKQPLRMKAIHS